MTDSAALAPSAYFIVDDEGRVIWTGTGSDKTARGRARSLSAGTSGQLLLANIEKGYERVYVAGYQAADPLDTTQLTAEARATLARAKSGTRPSQEQLLARIAPHEVAFWRTLGVEVVEADEGMARLRIPARPELETRRPDTLHGGVLASLIDAAGSAALLTTRSEDDETWGGFASTDLNVSYLAAATSDVVAEARVLRGGRRVVYTTVEVTDAAGTVVAVGRVTYMIARRQQS